MKRGTLYFQNLWDLEKSSTWAEMYSPEMPSLLKKTKNKEAEDTS